VKAFCAWCRGEGLVGFLGEREPLDDPGETHGICPRHAAALLADVTAQSRSGVRTLIVVHPREVALYEYLRRRLATVKDVEVIFDRRRGERRVVRQPVGAERRAGERRRRGRYLSPLGYLIVRVDRAPEADRRAC
jgi:hypothetical protein